ncbi:MAG TPA: serine protease, partial [Flavobacteriales bacterium]|nr:serine protease [Flavobacteriales bacterium]
MKKIFIVIFILSSFYITAQNNRMIIPSNVSPDIIGEMQEMGSNLTATDIYDQNQTSLNDAVIQFNGGCTGEIVSPKGLILTNHHCGYGAIQAHSTFEHNYVDDGFWAQSFEEELPNPGMYVTFVRKIDNVTDKVFEGVTDQMDANIKQALIQKNIKNLKKTYPKKDWQDIEIKSFYDGNQYYAFTTENYKDIRLVGAPPSSIGKSGADTDNWM